MNQPIPLVDLKTQSRAIKEDVLRRIADVIDGARYILGSEVQQFEEEFAEYCGTDHCVGMANGTEALHMALRALGIGQGDEVITVGNSFAATPFAIAYAGATPVFIDIDERDFNIDVELIEQAITERTKAIMPVHLYGQPSRMKEIRELADRYDLKVIEDAAQAHGAELDGKRCGSFGDIGCFSFYPGKNLGAFGDGGAVVTNDAALAEELRLLRNYGQKQKNRHDLLGFNCRLDTVQACVLLAKMQHIEAWTEQRRAVAGWYREALADVDVNLPFEHADSRHVYHLFVIRTPYRQSLMAALAEQDIHCGIHYPQSVAHRSAIPQQPDRSARPPRLYEGCVGARVTPDVSGDDKGTRQPCRRCHHRPPAPPRINQASRLATNHHSPVGQVSTWRRLEMGEPEWYGDR